MSATHILAINFNHDGSGVILSDGHLSAYVNTERFSRKKKHPGIREQDLAELLSQAALSLGEIDHVLLCNLNNMDSPDIPARFGTHLKETWPRFWIAQDFASVQIDGKVIPCTLNPEHHLLHAALAYYTAPFESAITVAADPLGCTSYHGRGHRLQKNESYNDSFNANLAYTYVATKLFKSGIYGAGKVMGLAPYGKPAEPSRIETLYRQLTSFEELTALAHEQPQYLMDGGKQHNAALAYVVQRGLELQLGDLLDHLFSQAEREGVEPNLCLGGGTALNSVANQVAFENSGFQRLHLHPACGDDGTAIGAALWHWHHRLGHPKSPMTNAQMMYSLRTYDQKIQPALEIARSRSRIVVEESSAYIDRTADLLAAGKIVGWYQGASEIGPRSLGNRSILADPRQADMKDKLNAKVKFREGFRPFAPTVLNEHAEAWFGVKDSPFMLRVTRVRKDGIPAVTHVDHSARIQTLDREDNPRYYELIERFFEKTGVPLLVNTSFNLRGMPIVETPEDALACFLESGMDYLVFEKTIVGKG